MKQPLVFTPDLLQKKAPPRLAPKRRPIPKTELLVFVCRSRLLLIDNNKQ